MPETNDGFEEPWPFFRFQLKFRQHGLKDAEGEPEPLDMCAGSFSECTGLEGTMEPKVIKEGGRNNGPLQRCGPVSYATVILKRGMSETRDLWNWFEQITSGAYAQRVDVDIELLDRSGDAPVITWTLKNALPIKFKAADLSAKNSEVSIEELHLAHEGLSHVEG
jgi:phage tail-like protein